MRLALTTMEKFERLAELSALTTTLDGINEVTDGGRKLVGVIFTGLIGLRDEKGIFKPLSELGPTDLVSIVSSHYSSPNLTETGELSPEAKRITLQGRIFDTSQKKLYYVDDPISSVAAIVIVMREASDAHQAGQAGSKEKA